jgi:hypothetical protein
VIYLENDIENEASIVTKGESCRVN